LLCRESEQEQPTLWWLFLVFIIGLLFIAAIFYNFPSLDPQELEKITLPRSIQDVQGIQGVLLRYTQTHYISVVSAFGACYLFLQAFAIPGSLFLSILGGALFGLVHGLILVVLVSTLGCCMAYWVAWTFGQRTIRYYFPDRLGMLRARIHQHSDSLFFYLLFLRISPVVPNWFMNISCAVLNVPFLQFAFASFLGMIPQGFLAVSTGLRLAELTTTSDLNVTRNAIILLAIAVAGSAPSWVPAIYSRIRSYLQGKEKEREEKSLRPQSAPSR
jgi:uncharacterized membrane protein YdjX (TVP38/TMEM64 family)